MKAFKVLALAAVGLLYAFILLYAVFINFFSVPDYPFPLSNDKNTGIIMSHTDVRYAYRVYLPAGLPDKAAKAVEEYAQKLTDDFVSQAKKQYGTGVHALGSYLRRKGKPYTLFLDYTRQDSPKGYVSLVLDAKRQFEVSDNAAKRFVFRSDSGELLSLSDFFPKTDKREYISCFAQLSGTDTDSFQKDFTDFSVTKDGFELVLSGRAETVVVPFDKIICQSVFSKPKLTPAKTMPKKRIAFTFDDGPNLKLTTKLLDGLKARGAKATFFVQGYLAQRYPKLLKRMADEGHLIGNHGYNHKLLTNITHMDAIGQVNTCNILVEKATGKQPYYLRPPGGACNDFVLSSFDMAIVLWSVDIKDWQLKDADAEYKKLIASIKEGDIILMHDVYEPSVDAALRVIDTLSAQGYEFVTVEELLSGGDETVPAANVVYRKK